MDISFDPAKDAANIAKHGLSLAHFEGFDSEPDVVVDDRYGERHPPHQFPPRSRKGDASL